MDIRIADSAIRVDVSATYASDLPRHCLQTAHTKLGVAGRLPVPEPGISLLHTCCFLVDDQVK